MDKKQFPKGITEDVLRRICQIKEEPEWMLNFRLEAFKIFKEKKLPNWGPDLSELDFDNITYYKSDGNAFDSWEEVPEDIKQTFDEIGVPEHEKKFLAGVSTQYDSEIIYHKLKQKWSNSGLIFETIEGGLRKYPEIFKKYFSTVIASDDNKFAALNSAVWSGGSFVYVPPGVKMEIPVETYFRINSKDMGQFERTLIIADKGSQVHYIEGCTAPQYSSNSLHAAVVEVIALEDAYVRYTTIQNWAKNIYNLVTKRAIAHKSARVEWVDCNIGSKVTMKYPGVVLVGEGAHGEVLSMALADSGQELDTGSKMIHLAPNTSSMIDSRTVSIGSGVATYRGIAKITSKALNSKAQVECDGLLLNDESVSNAYPHNIISNDSSKLEHEASVSKVDERALAYLQSRGFDEYQARKMIVSGFVDNVIEQLPMEYSVELERLLEIILKRDGKGHKKDLA